LTPYVPNGITGYDDDDAFLNIRMRSTSDLKVSWSEGGELEGVKKFGEDADRQKYLLVWI
jgi:hypothetical protein